MKLGTQPKVKSRICSGVSQEFVQSRYSKTGQWTGTGVHGGVRVGTVLLHDVSVHE